MYKYDALYRLTEATGRELASLQLPTHSDFANNIPVPNMASNAMQNYTQQFTYDELGNILQMKSVGRWTRDYNYDILHNNYLTGHAPRAVDYTYDEHGNMLSMPHLQSMHYDYKDQLDSVMLDASENMAYYIYDAGGQRVRKVVEKGYVREERIYVGGYEVFRMYENSTLDLERSTVHIMDDKNRVALIEKLKVYEGETVSGSEQIRYQYSNHLGSASLELNATGQIISYEEYHPFGTTSYRSGTNETEVSLKRYKYIGKERDEETGLYYYGFRYYAAWIARFINVDPLQHEYPHYTPFQYAGNKPVAYVDLDGLEPVLGSHTYGKNIIFGNWIQEAIVMKPDTLNENWVAFSIKSLDDVKNIMIGLNSQNIIPENVVISAHGSLGHLNVVPMNSNVDIANEDSRLSNASALNSYILETYRKDYKGLSDKKKKAYLKQNSWFDTDFKAIDDIKEIMLRMEQGGCLVFHSCYAGNEEGNNLLKELYLLGEGRISILLNTGQSLSNREFQFLGTELTGKSNSFLIAQGWYFIESGTPILEGDVIDSLNIKSINEVIYKKGGEPLELKN